MSNKYYKDTVKKLIPYSDQDYDSIMTSVIDSVPVLTPEYNDVSATDMGMTILEEAGKMADVLSWKADIAMNEALPGNSRSRKAALIQSKWLSYRPTQNISSETQIKFTINNDGNPITVPKGIKIATGTSEDDIIFETKDSQTFLPPEELPVDEQYDVFVDASSGVSVEELLGYSNGKPNQMFFTRKTPYIHGSMFLEILNPITGVITVFTEADYIFDIKNNENKFTLRFDERGYGTIHLGDGINGNVPIEDSTILSRYRIGGGSISNVSSGMVNSLIDNFDNRVLAVTNVSDAVGGDDEESIASINANAGNILKTRNRLVTYDDCEIWGRSQPGVDDAKIIKDTDYIDLYWLHLLPTNRNVSGLSEAVKNELKQQIDKLCMLGDDIRVADPVFKDVEVSIEITHDSLYDSINVKSGVFNELKELMHKKVFGETFYVSDIYQCVREVDGVMKMNIVKLCEKGLDTIGDVDCVSNEVVRLEYDEDIVITVL